MSEIKSGAKGIESRFNPDARMDNRYIDRAEKIDFAAKRNSCDWSWRPGDSKAIPDTKTDSGKVAADKLAEFGQRTIRFRDGEPDFSRVSLASAEIDVTGNYAKDKARACKAIAEQWNAEHPKPDGTKYTAQEVREWAKANRLELHHDSNMKTVRFVPAEIHRYFKHEGGVAEIKARNEVRNGSVFDD